MNGVINLLKPPGMTSHDAVALVRRAAGQRRVGHTGTLDPAASGVLPICLGLATRLVENLQGGTKEYLAELTFGHETDTLDAVGQTVREADASGITLDSLRAALDGFRGTIQQMPPLYSAIKQDGKKLYELARAGVDVESVEIKAREVTISQLVVTRWVPDAKSPRAMIHVECSGGTYVRSLARDIGRAVGSAATMTFLARTRNGAFLLDEARTIEEIASDASACLVPIEEVLTWCARIVVTDDAAVENLAHGRIIKNVPSESGTIAEFRQDSDQLKWRRTRVFWGGNSQFALFRNCTGTLAALASPLPEAGSYKAEKVFHLDAADD